MCETERERSSTVGRFSSIVPIYLKKVFADDPIFKEVKIVVSLYGDGFDKPLDAGMKEKISFCLNVRLA